MMIAEPLSQYDEVIRIAQEHGTLVMMLLRLELFVLNHVVLFGVLGLAWFAFHLHATATNLRDNRGVDRFMWLFTIWAIPFGIIFYWRFRDDASGARASLPPPDPHYTPPASSPQDTASAVTAALAEEARLRKQRRERGPPQT